ncbi:YolD-like family protein [Cytobacillus horneckiae]|uniref:YolD-like family protein n=1 Tax=Cytobacillus horneckiae TaxID=549687 RepID=UPI003D9A75BB
MNKDRGKKKWQGFFMPEHVQALKAIQREDSKAPRPILSEDQIEEMELTIAEALEGNNLLELTCWKDGFLNKRVGYIKKIDPVTRKIQLLDELDTLFQIDFLSIVKVGRYYS